MDRPIQADVRKKATFTRITRFVLAGAAVTGVLFWLSSWISPSIERTYLRTARVESGAMEASISATGTVIPEFEQVLSSPIDTRVLKILKKAGTQLHKDEPIVLLDIESSVLALSKLNDQLALKVNAQHQLYNTLENQLIKLESQIKIKRLDISSKKLRHEQNKMLLASKAISQNDFDQSLVDLETSEEQLRELLDVKKNIQQSTQLQKEGLSLEVSILQNERKSAEQQLALATTKADRDGVLTWVTQTEGASLRKGDIIAKIADLSSYRVDATVSDVHASKLAVGMPARIRIDNQTLKGAITNILPTIENGIVRLQISLDDKSNQWLRSNLRVDVDIVTASKQNTLKVKKTPFTGTEGKSELFVVRGDKAIKTLVEVGMTNFDYYEILGGLVQGDEIIISDMADYKASKELKIK